MKGSILIFSIVIAAFFWGYKREQIIAWTNELWQRRETPAGQGANAAPPPPAAQPNQPQPAAPPPSAMSPYQQAADAYRRMAETPAANQAKPREKALSETLDAIAPGAVTSDQVVRRNAYFEKLSQQLKELRGEVPPVNPAQPEAPPSPPSSEAREVPEENAPNPIAAPNTATPPEPASGMEPPPPVELPPPGPPADEEAAELQEEIDDLLAPR